MKLKNKVVIITGASRGMGRTTAILFAKEGADIVVNYNKSKDKALEVVKQIEKIGRKAISVKCDVSKIKELKILVNETMKEFKKIDILVNNVGIMPRTTLDDISEKTWDDVMNTNLKSFYFLSKYVSDIMLKQKSGKIINISSVVGLRPLGVYIEYCISKAGVITLTKCLAQALAPNILVNCICPGHVNTDMTGYKDNPEKLKKREKSIPLGKVAQPEDIANAALFLASTDSDHITGETLIVDGGKHLVK